MVMVARTLQYVALRGLLLPLLIVAFATYYGFAQFKSELDHQPSSSETLIKPNASIGNFLGLLDANNFSMHHSFAINYLSSNAGGLSLASYTNSMFLKISDPLNVHLDVTLMGSPFGSYAGYQQNDYNKIFISRAELNYKPWDNTLFKVEYNQLPFGGPYYYNSFAPSPFYPGEH